MDMTNLKNLPPFYLGERVVYITGLNMPKDSVHTVTDLLQDSCGCYKILINGEQKRLMPSKNKLATHWNCEYCKRTYSKKGATVWDGWDINSFRSVQSRSFPLLTFSEIKQTEFERVNEPEILISN